MVVTRSWEMRNDDLLVAEFLLGQFQVLEMANRDSYTDMCLYLMLLNCPFRDGYDGRVYVTCILP